MASDFGMNNVHYTPLYNSSKIEKSLTRKVLLQLWLVIFGMEKFEKNSFASHTLLKYGTDLTQMAKEVTIFCKLCNYVYFCKL